MNRNIRILGIALIAVLAMSAVAASAAQAESTFTADSYPVTLVGENEGPYEFKFGSNTISCTVVDYHAELSEESTELEIEPNYEGCVANGVVQVKTTANGCYYKGTALKEIKKDVFEGAQHLICPKGKTMETHGGTCIITHFSANDVENLLLSDHTGGPKKRFTIVNENKGSRIYDIDAGALCPLSPGHFEDGESFGSVTMLGEDSKENPVGVYVG